MDFEFDYGECSYSTATNIRTLLHWYNKWNTREREKFMKSLTERAVPNKADLLLESLTGMSVEDESPPNIFQCQMRMFVRWFDEWSSEERNFMLERLETLDPIFVEELYARIRSTTAMS